MRYSLNERLKQLEHKTFKGILPPIWIDILGDGMVEIYSEEDGKKKRMTEEAYELWAKRLLKSGETIQFEIDVGEWESSTVFIDDIPPENE